MNYWFFFPLVIFSWFTSSTSYRNTVVDGIVRKYAFACNGQIGGVCYMGSAD